MHTVKLSDRDIIDLAYSLRVAARIIRDEAHRISDADPELRRERVRERVTHANELEALAKRVEAPMATVTWR